MEGTVPRADTDVLRDGLTPLPAPLPKAVLVVVSGLPGTGKSHFCRCLVSRLPAAVLETDALRKHLFPSPSYSAEESTRLFRAVHALIEELLRRGIPVVLDATNLVEAHRERLYNISDRVGAKLILVRAEAPAELVRERLEKRRSGAEAREDYSDADWSVYQRMASTREPIVRNHLVVDTSRDMAPVIDKVMREVRRWIKI
ncbi:MAG: ATP-binding protein [Chloroflexi bacterium]|nr:ATP-binding protein [Chloroflexota bacterium]